MSRIENKVLSDLAYEKIRHLIDDGKLSPGQKINKAELADLLGVSQTPINDALSRLSGERFIELKSRQGFFIKSYSNFELSHVYEVRGALEGMAIRLCVEEGNAENLETLASAFAGFGLPVPESRYAEYFQSDRLFHENVVRFSGNGFLMELARTSGYLAKSNQKGLVRCPNETLPEHREIAASIRRREAVHAQELMIRHLLRTRDKLRRTGDGLPAPRRPVQEQRGRHARGPDQDFMS